MTETTKPKFRCSACLQEWDTYASAMVHCRNKAECKARNAQPEAIQVPVMSPYPKDGDTMSPEEKRQWLENQAKAVLQIPVPVNGAKKPDSPPPEIRSGMVDEEEEIERPGWPVKSMAQQAASQPLPDWVDEEGIEFPPFPEDYRPPERDVSAVSLIARGQAIVLDAIEIAAYEAWCREGWDGSLKQWVSECIAGYFTMLGIEITAFSVPQPQREYILAKAGLKDASG